MLPPFGASDWGSLWVGNCVASSCPAAARSSVKLVFPTFRHGFAQREDKNENRNWIAANILLLQ